MGEDVKQFASERIVVPKPLSDEQVESYIGDGFLVVKNVLTRTEMDELFTDMVKLLRGGYECPQLKPLPATMSDEEVLRSFSGVIQAHFISPVCLQYVKHPKVCGILSQIIGAHVPYWDGSIKCMQSMYFVKPPGFPGQAWHQDELYIPTRDRSLIGAWIALDDATIENGCLYVIPGSHQSGYLHPQEAHTKEDEWDFAPESKGFDESKKVPVEVKAGTLVFFNGYLLHCSYKNRSNVYRRVLVNHYMNSWSHLPWHFPMKDGKPVPEAPSRLDIRNVIPVAGIDPYAWKGYENPPQNVWLRTCKANRPTTDPSADHLKKKEEPAAAAAKA